MKGPLKFQSWRWTTGLLGPAVLLVSDCGAAAGADLLPAKEFKIPLWNFSTSLRGGFGYNDNVLLNHTNAQGSGFWMSGAEVMVFRLPTHGWQFTFFADISDSRFFDSPNVDNEQVALAASQLTKDFGNDWKSTVGLNYVFQNQVFDFSDAYTNQASVGQIVGHTLKPRWSARRTFGKFWVEGELNGARQWLAAPLDSYWQFGPRAAVGYAWQRGSELALAYQYARLDYDHRQQVDQAGAAIANTAMALNSHSLELSLAHVWDQKRHWQTTTAIGFDTSLDNGAGFFDYENYHLSQRIRYRDEKWEVTALAGLSHYAFLTQTVSTTDPTLRHKTMINVSLRMERKLNKHLLAHASYNWERSISNLDFDDYQANTVMGGLALTFQLRRHYAHVKNSQRQRKQQRIGTPAPVPNHRLADLGFGDGRAGHHRGRRRAASARPPARASGATRRRDSHRRGARAAIRQRQRRHPDPTARQPGGSTRPRAGDFPNQRRRARRPVVRSRGPV